MSRFLNTTCGEAGRPTFVRILVIDFDSNFTGVLERALVQDGHRVQVASSVAEALTSLGENEFDFILVDSYIPAGPSQDIVREIFTQTSSMVYVMTEIPVSGLGVGARRAQTIEIVPATAESVLSIVRETADSDVALVVGCHPPPDWARALSEEGYPAVAADDIPGAIRLFWDGAYPVVFLQAAVPRLMEAGQFAVLHRLTARGLAVLADAQPATDLRSGVKPQKTAEVQQILDVMRRDCINAGRLSPPDL